ncbi:MAG TPA: hypothetical protein ENJ05_08140 [Thiotrichales bacterium]|nr:hypothetical protein [Thiotrichales bacterium]
MDKRTERAIRRLGSRLPLLGPGIRARAARRLVGTAAPEAVAPLLALREDPSRKVRDQAAATLRTLEGAALSEEVLAACLGDTDEAVVRGALDWAGVRKGDEAPAWVWRLARDRAPCQLARLLHARGWRPEAAAERALFYLLAGDLAASLDIDFEQEHLRAWYQDGTPALREAIAARIRESGDVRLLAVFRTVRGTRRQALAPEEVALQIDLLVEAGRHAELFALLPYATWAQGRRILEAIEAAAWQPAEAHGRELLARLLALAGKADDGAARPDPTAEALYRDFRPMFLGDETPPQYPAGLRRWAKDRDHFRRRSAAVILMAEGGLDGLAEVANAACADPWWQVRMACACAERLRPGILSPANRAALEQDHVYWVRASFGIPAVGDRLVDLGPQGLEILSRGGTTGPGQRPEAADDFFERVQGFLPTAERDYLLTLGEFLGTEVSVSEEAAYGAGEEDVEIEWE